MRAKISRETEVTIKTTLQGSEQETRVKAVNNAANYYANKSEEFAEISKQYSEDSEDYSNLAKDWANKLSDTVDGLEYSSKYYAQKAKEAFQDTSEQVKRIEDTTQEGIDLINETKNQGLVDIETSKDGATLDVRNAETTALNNINETKVSAINNINNVADSRIEQIDSKSDSFLNKNQITNCITEIPQRIKLELNNGVLTLKAGSQVIVPNGFEEDGVTKKFIHEQLENDISRVAAFNTQHYVFPALEINIFDHYINGNTFVQDTQPIVTYKDNCWYDTSVNRFKITKDTGKTWNEVNYGLPVAITTSSTTGYTSIDQEFNGFGFLKNLVWVDKGVKGLIPDGRYEDGSLKNIEWTNNSIIIRELSSVPSGSNLIFDYVGTDYNTHLRFFDPSLCYVDLNTNKWVNKTTGIMNTGLYLTLGLIESSSNVISKLQPKTTFHAIDYNDKSEISSWGMPSGKSVNLSIGASGTTYTVPANGYVTCETRMASAGVGVVLRRTSPTGMYARSIASANNQLVACTLPFKKNDKFVFEYGALATTNPRNYLAFIYAEGEV